MKPKSKKYALFFLLIFVIVVIAGIWGWLGGDRRSGTSAPAISKVIRRDFASTVLATGIVKSQVGAEVRVGARISGKVERLYANIGDPVKKGQIVAELENADLEATVAQRKAELRLAEAKLSAVNSLLPRETEKAEADVSQYEATLNLAKWELARLEDLVKKDFTSIQNRDRSKERLSVAQAQLAAALKILEITKVKYLEELKQAKSDIERANAALDYVKIQLSYATITASISGIIASVSTQEGETVAAGLNAPTFVTIIDLMRLQVDAYVDEVDIGRINVSQHAMFTVDTFPNREFEGNVVAIYPKAVIQNNVVNYDVVIEITTPYVGLLRPEMTAGVTIFLETRTNVLAIPAKAVKREQGKNVVYTLKNGEPELCEIKVGWQDGQWIEVVEGLKEGQTVLLELPSENQK